MKDLFDHRQLSRTQAQLIADWQTDLGGESKKDMVVALGGFKHAKSYDDLLQGRIEAYERLDEISKMIVRICLNEDLEIARNSMEYTIDCLKRAESALEYLNQ